MSESTGLDRNGSTVRRGDLVRLHVIRPSILKRLQGAEHVDVSSMLGQVLSVFDVYDDGLVWVSLSWLRADGTTELHAVAVDPDAIELVPTQAGGTRSS
jgi:hypothetical protein